MNAAAQTSGRNVNYDESKVAPYALPEVLTCGDGQKVTTAEEWTQQRRPELLALFEQHVFGRTPTNFGRVAFEVRQRRTDALEGRATRKIVAITLPDRPAWAGIEAMIYIPNGLRRSAPCFVGASFSGNHAVTTETDVPLSTRWMRAKGEGIVNNRATEANRGVSSSRWPIRRILDAGFALATYYYGDVEPDHPAGWKEGVRAALPPAGSATVWTNGDWGAIGAWAWGLSRVADYLETDPDIDAGRLAVIGHSRLGKTALWAGAQDLRFKVVISNNSGEGGAALMRRNYGETTALITRTFPYWFTPTHATYADNEAACPVDHHMLIALIAPRAVYVASAVEDRWADPLGEFLSAYHAGPVYALFGKVGVGVEAQPPVDTPVGDNIGYHVRSGGHGVLEYDWDQYLRFARRHLGQ